VTCRPKGVEDLALDLRRGLPQGVGEIRDAREQRGGVLVGAGVDRGGGEAAERDLGRVFGFSELGDALADEVGLDPAFERGDLQADAPVEVGDLLAQLALPGVGLLAGGLLVGTEPRTEFKPKNPLRKNIEFFIGLRNRIEHRYDAETALLVSGKTEALMLNYEDYLTETSGFEEGLAEELRFPIFVSSITGHAVTSIKEVRKRVPMSVRT
jgi:hypothetical protein